MDLLPHWPGQTVAVIGAGQSAKTLAPRLCGQCRIIAVNLSFRLTPCADILYAADTGFWSTYRDALKFPGLKLTVKGNYARQLCSAILPIIEIPYNGKGKRITEMIWEPRGRVGSGGGNSGYQAVNLAAQLIGQGGTILMAGLDYGGPHWHEDHHRALGNPSEGQLSEWRRHMDLAYSDLQDRGIKVINLSDISTLRAFPHDEPDRYLLNQVASPLSA